MNWKKKFKNQFKVTPPTEELEYDICMKCGKKLKDNKRITLEQHKAEFHPLKKYEGIKNLIGRYFILIALIVAVGVMSLLFAALDYFDEDISNYIRSNTPINDCLEDSIRLKSKIYSQQEFLAEDVPIFNNLLKNCDATFTVNSTLDLLSSERYEPGNLELQTDTWTSKTNPGTEP